MSRPFALGVQLKLVEVASRSYLVPMRSVGLKILKNKLSEYVRLAASGETVLVTDRDRIVAELVPPRKGQSPLLADALLEDLIRQGWLKPPLIVAEGPPPRCPMMSYAELERELEQDREDR